jgi:hypothetical protein
MKTLRLFLISVAMSLPALAQDNTNNTGRISIAEVGTVRLEVEQPSISRNEIQIRVRDFAARNRQMNEVSCNLYDIRDDGKEARRPFMSVALKQVASDSDDYSGGATNRVEFEHGNKFKVVYQSNGLPLPVSTWYACYYH